MKHSIGIMQGRLSAPSPQGPQIFPAATWREEFAAARDLGFDAIEWLIALEGMGENPLMSSTGRAELAKMIATTGVAVLSACAHCILQWRPYDEGGVERLKPFSQVIAAAGAAGIKRLIVPILEDATTAKMASLAQAAAIFRPAILKAEEAGVDLAFEMDRPAIECRAFVGLLASPRARLCYDSGNATAKGYDIVEEIELLLPVVAEIHLKDRLVGGISVPLGQGQTRFPEFFQTLRKHNWAGPFVLETPRGDDPRAHARKNLALVKQYLA